jgi:hypothetical protein
MVLALGVQSAPTAIVLALLVSASRSTPHGESVVPMNCHRNDNNAPGHTSRGRHSSRPVQHRG